MEGGDTTASSTAGVSMEPGVTLWMAGAPVLLAGRDQCAASDPAAVLTSLGPTVLASASATQTIQTHATRGLATASVSQVLLAPTATGPALSIPMDRTAARFVPVRTLPSVSPLTVPVPVALAGWGSSASNPVGRAGMARTAGTSAGAGTEPNVTLHPGSVLVLLAGEECTVTPPVHLEGGERSASRSAGAGMGPPVTTSLESASARPVSREWTVRFPVKGGGTG